jgi:starch phosphorylase
VRAYVSLGDLSPQDVDVQVVHGHAQDSDDLTDVEVESLDFVESYEGGRHQFAGDFALSRTGSFGYTVRILPKHTGLASTSELGLVVNA